MPRVINTAIIGFGIAGKVFHAPFLTAFEGFNLSTVSTSKKETKEEVQKRYPWIKVVPDAASIINDPSIELVVIGTPNTTHLPLTEAALKAGKHVIVDKPFTITSADADELIDLADKAGRVLSVHHNRRWDGHYKTVKKIIDSGLLGRLVDFEARYDRFRPSLRENAWREKDLPGSGILYDLGAHLIDQSVTLFGLPTHVFSDLRIEREGAQANDKFELLLYYPELKVGLHGGMLAKEKKPSYTLYGDKGSFIKYGMDVQEDALKAGIHPKDRADWGIEPAEMWGSLDTTINGLNIKGKVETETGNYLGYFANVYEAITGKAALVVPAKDARNVIRVIELAMQSSLEQRVIPFSN